MKKIILLGATGTVGKKVLEVIKDNKESLKLIAIAVNKNYKEAIKICNEFKVENLAIFTQNITNEKIKHSINSNHDLKIYKGFDGLISLIQLEADIVINCISGSIGLLPTIESLRSGKDVAIANKEPLVIAGKIILQEAHKFKRRILPIDSEHSALYQLLLNDKDNVEKVIITASGGSLRDFNYKRYKEATLEEVLKHPNWKMGKKITVDSATMVNKALEVIEAHNLFSIPYNKIDVIIQRESFIHSLVCYKDGNIKSLMSQNDMKIPVNYALFNEKRNKIFVNYDLFDICKYNTLNFSKVNIKKYPLFTLCLDSAEKAPSYPIVFNAVNEVAVDFFLNKKITFNHIYTVVRHFIETHTPLNDFSLEEILQMDKEYKIKTKEYILKNISKFCY